MTETKNLFDALAKFQERYEPPKKDKKVDFTTKKGERTNYSYADHQNVTDTIRKTGAPLGLAYSTSFIKEFNEVSGYNGALEKKMFITAIVTICHSSGESLKVEGIPMSPSSYTPQEMGSARTYAERYALSSAFGISTTDDDDGSMASQISTQNQVDGETLKKLTELKEKLLSIDGCTKEWLESEIVKKTGFNTSSDAVFNAPNQVMQLMNNILKTYQQKQQQNTYAWGQ